PGTPTADREIRAQSAPVLGETPAFRWERRGLPPRSFERVAVHNAAILRSDFKACAVERA
ncbi:MAG TPA: hypothetical protein VII48_01335, partial [Rhizomicrobium sp.]